LPLYTKFTAKSVGESILKISQHLAKLVAKYSGHGLVSGRPVMTHQ